MKRQSGEAIPITPDGLPARVQGRRREVLAAAARVFAEKGYQAASIRDIGRAVGLLGGSLYHYIKSKEELFIELHEAALDAAAEKIAARAEQASDPWERLARACECLLEIRLDPHSITIPMMNDFQSVPPAVRERLVVKRDAFEEMFRDLVADLPLPPEFDRSIFRNFLLSTINASPGWFRQGRCRPEELASQLMLIFRH